MKLSQQIEALNKKALPAPWEAIINDDNEMIAQTLKGDKLKPLLALAQLSSKEDEIKLLVLLRNNVPAIVKALRKQNL